MHTVPYSDPAAVIALEAELAALMHCEPQVLPRDALGCYVVDGQMKECYVTLLERGQRRYVHLFSPGGVRLPESPANLAEANRLTSELLGAKLFLVGENLIAAADLPLSALGTGEIEQALELVTKAALAAASFPDQVE